MSNLPLLRQKETIGHFLMSLDHVSCIRCKIKHLTHQVTVGAPGEKRGRGRCFNTSITFNAFSVEKMLASIFKMHAKQIIKDVDAGHQRRRVVRRREVGQRNRKKTLRRRKRRRRRRKKRKRRKLRRMRKRREMMQRREKMRSKVQILKI